MQPKNQNRLAAAGVATPSTKGYGKTDGQSGTHIFRGIITAEEYNRNLVGKLALRIYDIMRRSDATVHQALLVCKLPIMAADWSVEAASEDEADQYAARFVQQELMERNVNFTAHVRQALGMLDFGYSVCEKTYELITFESQTRVGLKELGFRKQVSILRWETTDNKPGVTQQLVTEQVSIPMQKLIVYTNDKEGDNYEGISVLRYAYKDWDMKDKLGLVNAIALEKLAVGVPVLTRPADADEAQIAKAREVLREFRANEEGYLEKPAGWDIEMLDMKANNTKDVIPTIHYHDRQIVRTVLAQFLELGSAEGSGSRSLSEDHSRLFEKALEAVAKTLQESIQEQLVKQLCDLNFSDLPNGYPKVKVGSVADDNVAVLSDAINKLVTAGAIRPDFAMEQRLRTTLHLPPLDEELDPDSPEYIGDELADKKFYKKAAPPAANPTTDGIIPPEQGKTKPATDTLKASAIARARASRKQLIDILVRE